MSVKAQVATKTSIRAGIGAFCTSLVMCFAIPAQGAPKPIAVINLSVSQGQGAQVAAKLRGDLAAHPRLRPIAAGDLSRSLETALPSLSPQERAVSTGRTAIAAARKAREAFEHAKALTILANAEPALLRLAPSLPVLKVLADLNFEAGINYSRTGKLAAMRDAFRLCRALVPQRPAPLRREVWEQEYDAYHTADNSQTSATLAVSASYDQATIFVNGTRLTKTPGQVRVVAGSHYVVAIFPGHAGTGLRVRAVENGTLTVPKLRTRRHTPEEQATHLRQAHLENPRRLRTHYQQISRSVSVLLDNQVDAIVVIRDSRLPGVTEVAVFDRTARQITAWRDAHTTNAADLLGKLLAAPTVVNPRSGSNRKRSDSASRPNWLLRAAIAVGVTAAVLTGGSYLLRDTSPSGSAGDDSMVGHRP